MPARRQVEDVQVIRLKLVEVNEYIRALEVKVIGLSGRLAVKMSDPAATAEDIQLVLIEGLEQVLASEFSTSLIKDDLEQEWAKANPGRKLWFDAHAWIPEAGRALADAIQSGDDPKELASGFAAMVTQFVNAALRPARLLRDRLVRSLDSVANQPRETEGSERRRLRDERILELAKINNTDSPALVLKLARADSGIMELNATLSIDTVRKALEKLKSPAKRKPKNTGSSDPK